MRRMHCTFCGSHDVELRLTFHHWHKAEVHGDNLSVGKEVQVQDADRIDGARCLSCDRLLELEEIEMRDEDNITFKVTIHSADGLPRVSARHPRLVAAVHAARAELNAIYGPRSGKHIAKPLATQVYASIDGDNFVPIDFAGLKH